jgi:ElaB/YqjD/DUF883 family membrane-anchored ribosome-binding protein
LFGAKFFAVRLLIE